MSTWQQVSELRLKRQQAAMLQQRENDRALMDSEPEAELVPSVVRLVPAKFARWLELDAQAEQERLDRLARSNSTRFQPRTDSRHDWNRVDRMRGFLPDEPA
ncbi:MAG: hypothetical protein HC769_31495 [Cyanobacteria bacterium CRU_2_1]|nr:hypothetical protein [Cyanobacteria bacterium CRU_2_1]